MPFVWGNTLNGDKANCDGNDPYGTEQKGPYLEKTTEVGSYESKAYHPLGLCDMHGNVWEWCRDWYGGSYEGLSTKDPTGPADGVRRVGRGGSWCDLAANCRAAYRVRDEPGFRYDSLGFRPALPELPHRTIHSIASVGRGGLAARRKTSDLPGISPDLSSFSSFGK
jgi:formylglycine-generating enzyme required for sulfatase activity